MSTVDIAVVVAAVVAGSLIKSITGFGLPLIAIPVMSLIVGTDTAVALIAIPTVLQNLLMCVNHRDARHGSTGLVTFCAVGVVGAVLGALTLGVVPQWCTSLALVVIVGGFVATALSGREIAFGDATVRRFNAPVGFVAGIFQGAIGISGPIVGTWYHGRRLSTDAFVFSVSAIFFVTGLAQAIVLAARGVLFEHRALIVVLTVIVLATVPLGQHLRGRLSGPAFERLVLLLLAASCVSLVIDVL